jgi:putative membrane protein
MFKRVLMIVTIASSFVAIGATAAAQSAGTATQSRVPDNQPPPVLNVTDSAFVRLAGQSGQVELSLATMAQSKAKDPRVKAFAEQLVKDHQQANTELDALAAKKDVKIPAVADLQKTSKDRLDKLDGAAFDRAFVAQMVRDHTKAIADFTKALTSKDADVKAFVGKTLPTLKEHLRVAQQLQKP